MPWYFYVVRFIAAALLANSIPHFVNGISGRRFISPFGKPPGRGESSAVSNVAWGASNIIVAGVLLWFWPMAMPLDLLDVLVFAVGFFGAALGLAQGFQRRQMELSRL